MTLLTLLKCNDNYLHKVGFLLKTKILLLLILISVLKASATGNNYFNAWQNTVVTGKVIDENEKPLPGVSITIKNTTIGTTTNVDGNYSLNIPDQHSRGNLVFSFLGYLTKEIAINSKYEINTSLLPDQTSLDEVVVVGYGAQKKSTLTGSVSSIKGSAIQDFPVASVEQAMQGRMAGVQVQLSSGQPGAGISVRVRGPSSIAGGNEPLFVIDGVPQSSGDVRGTNTLSSINPNDIEAIEVLKDASATAIYGSRGANGVVMVTTKSGKSGQVRINYNGTTGIANVRRKLDLMNGDEFLAYAKEWSNNSGIAVSPEITNSRNANTDWQDEVFRSAVQQEHNLGFQGGNSNTNYYLSAGFLDQDGIVSQSNFKRGGVRLNMNSKISERISISSRLFASRSVLNGVAPSDGTTTRNFGKSVIGSTLINFPTVPVFTNGDYSNPKEYIFTRDDIENPVAFINETLDRNTTNRFQGVVEGKVEIQKGLTNTIRLSADNLDRRADTYFPKILPQLSSGFGTGILDTYNLFSALGENFLEYKRNVTAQLTFDGIAGISFQDENSRLAEIQGTNFLSDDLKSYNLNAAGTIVKPETDFIRNTIFSMFARVNFGFQEKYLLSASIRRDGASVFSDNNKYAVFPSASAAWRLSEENFLKNNSLISNLKLRFSWGESGNQAIRPYQSLPLATTVNTGQGGGAGIIVGLGPTLPNKNLTWETTAQTNLGLDFGFLQEKLRGSIDLYRKTTRDLLATVQLPPSAGFNSIIANVGSVENKGVELSLAADIFRKKDFVWQIDGNVTYNKNEVLHTIDNQDLLSGGTGDASRASALIRPGFPLSSHFGIKFLGFDASGTQLLQDVNNDKLYTAADNVPLGSPYPEWIFGLNTSVNYKQFGFSMNWQGVEDMIVNNVGLFELINPQDIGANKLSNIRDYYPKPKATDQHIRSSLFFEDASYIRLRNVRVDYKLLKLPKALKNLGVFVSGQNLITITDYTGFDPEVNSLSGNDLRQGVDLGAYPAAKTFTLGINAGF